MRSLPRQATTGRATKLEECPIPVIQTWHLRPCTVFRAKQEHPLKPVFRGQCVLAPRARSSGRAEEMLVDELRSQHDGRVGREEEDRPHEPAPAAHDGAPEDQQQTAQN